MFHVLGLTGLALAMLLSVAILGMPLAMVGHKLDSDAKRAEAQRKAQAKAAKERQAKEMDELYKARPEWGFKPNTPHQP